MLTNRELPLQNLIVGVFQVLCGLVFLIVIPAGGILAIQSLTHLFDWNGWFSAFIGAFGAFLLCCVLFGPLFVMMRIDDNIAALRSHFAPVEMRQKLTVRDKEGYKHQKWKPRRS